MPTSLAGLLSALIAVMACGYALMRGRTPERIAGGALLAATVLNILVQDRVNWIDPQRRQLALDVLLMIVFAVLASTTRRTWVIPATAAQLLSCVVRFAAPFAPGVHAMALLSVENALAYVLLASIAWGTFQVATLDGRATAAEAAAEAKHLVSLYGDDVAYEVAERHYGLARGRRRAVLDQVMMEITDRRDGGYKGDTATRWGR